MYDAKQLKTLRKLLGLTCEEVGKNVYLSRQQISNIETGKSDQKSTLLLLNYWYDDYMKKNQIEVIDLINNIKDELL